MKSEVEIRKVRDALNANMKARTCSCPNCLSACIVGQATANILTWALGESGALDGIAEELVAEAQRGRLHR